MGLGFDIFSTLFGPLVNAGTSVANGIMQYNANKENIALQRETNAQNLALTRESWARDDNATQRAVKDVTAAGFSPLAALQNGGGNSGFANMVAPQVSPVQLDNTVGDSFTNALNSYNQRKLNDEQRKVLKQEKISAGLENIYKQATLLSRIDDLLGSNKFSKFTRNRVMSFLRSNPAFPTIEAYISATENERKIAADALQQQKNRDAQAKENALNRAGVKSVKDYNVGASFGLNVLGANLGFKKYSESSYIPSSVSEWFKDPSESSSGAVVMDANDNSITSNLNILRGKYSHEHGRTVERYGDWNGFPVVSSSNGDYVMIPMESNGQKKFVMYDLPSNFNLQSVTWFTNKSNRWIDDHFKSTAWAKYNKAFGDMDKYFTYMEQSQ